MYAMNEDITRFEQAALDRRLRGYVGFRGPVEEPPSLPRKGELTSPGVYAPPRLVSSREYARGGQRLGGRELFAWALAGSLAVTNLAGAIAWLLR